MSKVAVESLKGTFSYSWSLLEKFIDVCPEDLWVKKFGGWPIWQNVYHAIGSIDFFVLQEGDKPTQAMFSHTVSSLSEVATGPVPTRQDLKAVMAELKKTADKYFDGLGDAQLKDGNEGLSQRMPSPWTNAATCAMLAAHTMYHLGICDAALRERGLEGVF